MCLKGQSNEIFNLQFFFIIRTYCTEPTYLQYLPSYLLYQRVSLFSIFIKISKSFSNFKFKARRGLRPREIDLPELLLSVWCPGELLFKLQIKITRRIYNQDTKCFNLLVMQWSRWVRFKKIELKNLVGLSASQCIFLKLLFISWNPSTVQCTGTGLIA